MTYRMSNLETRLAWHARGRADALLTLAEHLGWTDTLVDSLARDALQIDRADVFHARKRRQDYAE